MHALYMLRILHGMPMTLPESLHPAQHLLRTYGIYESAKLIYTGLAVISYIQPRGIEAALYSVYLRNALYDIPGIIHAFQSSTAFAPYVCLIKQKIRIRRIGISSCQQLCRHRRELLQVIVVYSYCLGDFLSAIFAEHIA